jgi:Secretion system C-terminal sorting domain
MSFSNTGTAAIPHRLLATDINSVVFQSGSVFTAGLGFGGNAFANFTLNVICFTFSSGSRYISKAGLSPFGPNAMNPVAAFQNGSTYQHDQTGRILLSGNTFGNVEITKVVVGSTPILSTPIINGNLTIKSGGGAILNYTSGGSNIGFFSLTNPYKLIGDLIVENGGSLTLGSGTNITNFIIGGNLIVRTGGILILGTGTSNNLVVLNRDLLVESGGSLTFGTGTTNLFLRGTTPQTITNNSGISFGVNSKLTLRNQSAFFLGSNLEVQDLEFYAFNNTDQIYPCRLALYDYDLKVNGNIIGLTNHIRHIETNGTGKLKRPVGSTPVLFPVRQGGGSSGGDFVTLTNIGTPDEFSVNVNSYFIAPPYNFENILNRVWNINEGIVGGSNVTMILNSEVDGRSFIPANVVLGHGNPNGTFNALPATFVVDASFNGTLTANNVTTFSPFIIANDVALGVTLTNFSAQLTNKNTMMLNWQTENEKDNSGFEIQRSADAKNWSNIGFVKGKGQSSVAFDYTFEDKGPLSILTYYRLKQVDFDGKATYSKVINVLAKKNNNQFSVFPNPAKGKTTTLELNEDLVDGTLTVTNAIGSIVKKQTINSKTLTLDLSTLTNGLYIFEIQKGVNRYFEKVIIGE